MQPHAHTPVVLPITPPSIAEDVEPPIHDTHLDSGESNTNRWERASSSEWPAPSAPPAPESTDFGYNPILAETILLGFQHYLVMLGTTVLISNALVTHMGGRHDEKSKVIQTFLFVAGLNTLAQTVFGTRLPAVMGGSYTFVLPAFSIIVVGRHLDIVDPRERFKQTV